MPEVPTQQLKSWRKTLVNTRFGSIAKEIDVILAGPVVPPPPPPPSTSSSAPPPGVRVNTGPLRLASGANSFRDLAINSTAGAGIMGDNATKLTSVTLSNVGVESFNYSLYVGDCDRASLDLCDFHTNGGPDDYVCRGYFRLWESQDSTFINRGTNKAVWRIYGCLGGHSLRDIFTGSRMMLGGGFSNEWDRDAACGEFQDFTFTDSKINVPSIELYMKTKRVTFKNVDFSGTGHISIQPECTDIHFIGCKNLPEIRRYGTNGLLGIGPDPSRAITVI